MNAFNILPSLGFTHRPVFGKFEDEHGKPLTRRDARQKLLEAGWEQAPQTLSDADEQKARPGLSPPSTTTSTSWMLSKAYRTGRMLGDSFTKRKSIYSIDSP